MSKFIIEKVKNFKWGKEVNQLEIEAEEIKDEYHSMHELYQHRMALNMALATLINFLGENNLTSKKAYKSKFHSDGTMFDGYFIVVIETNYGQISYHYKLEHWNEFRLPEIYKCPEYDGHTSKDVIERLIKISQ